MVTAFRYFKYPNDESLIGGMTYAETLDGYHIREICFNGLEYFASNVKRPPWGLCKAEGQVDYDELMPEFPEIAEITKQEFDEIWNTHLTTRQEIWNQVKQSYPIGMAVQGMILLFFPQGTIVDLGGDAIGVADYEACRASNESKYLGSRQKITAVVKDYDETYQWIILDSPHVYAERIE
ncbi:MAG: hypothetical protein BroJett018_04340 [Chloroflexota bacterium]|nr:hypothetical protein [Chloroflexota bacterium]NOG61772.1 hypothetical protein [Chloroflexota bacterium]GIK62640.1 MAG: hypothetical protein BroJett018_04340 [Chloroflexota bacterium]